jgi:hypothetical protein
MKNTTQITLNLNPKIVKMFQDRLDELEEEVYFTEWLEMEFNQNGEALLEMLLGDF